MCGGGYESLIGVNLGKCGRRGGGGMVVVDFFLNCVVKGDEEMM